MGMRESGKTMPNVKIQMSRAGNTRYGRQERGKALKTFPFNLTQGKKSLKSSFFDPAQDKKAQKSYHENTKKKLKSSIFVKWSNREMAET